MACIEDFYDKPSPVKVVLVGGPRDGERMTVPERWLPMLQLPLPKNPFTMADMDAPLRLVTDDTCVYHWSGSISDDGTRNCTYVR